MTEYNLHESRMDELIQFTRSKKSEPYGCAIYDEAGEKLAVCIGNEISPINHAEVLAINEVAKNFPHIRWETLTLYTTGEPCCMCAAACCWANLKEVVYATDVPFMIQLWGIESPIRAADIIKTYPKQPKLVEYVRKEESNRLFLDCKESFAKHWCETRWSINHVY